MSAKGASPPIRAAPISITLSFAFEPREASQIALPSEATLSKLNKSMVEDALSTLRQWRHYAVAQ